MVEITNFCLKKDLNLKEIELLLEKLLKKLNLKKDLYVFLIGASRMKKLNKKFRNKNQVTSVLSFASPKEFIYPKKKKVLGEIFLCPTHIKRLSQKAHLNFKTYFLKTLIHGLVHLLGFNHQSQKEAEVFQKKEIQIFSLLQNFLN